MKDVGLVELTNPSQVLISEKPKDVSGSVLLRYFHDMKVIYSSYSVSIIIMFALLYFSYKKHICAKYFKQEVPNID